MRCSGMLPGCLRLALTLGRRTRRARAAAAGVLVTALLAATLPLASSAADTVVNGEEALLPGPVPESGDPSVPDDPEQAPLGDDATLAAFVDGIVSAQLRAHRIPGMVVAVVSSEGVRLLEGWGYADLAERRPVDAETTLFRIGSLTKTFVWTALMAEVEAGTLDLDAAVEGLLPEVEPFEHDGEVVTLADLMTHSGGFEERAIGMLADDADGLPELEAWLVESRPALVYRPGAVPAYSNYGTALAARLLERSAGEDWDALLAERFLEPLQMDATTTAQPPPGELAERLAVGYQWRGGAFRAEDFWYLKGAPAGSMSATAADMARWLQLHLNRGEVDGERILPAAVFERMHAPLREFGSVMPPFLHGLYRMDRNGETIFGHHGGINHITSVMALFPERDLGVFAAYNVASLEPADELVDTIAARLAPRALPKGPARDRVAAEASRYAGFYAATRRNHSTLEKASLLANAIEVRAADDGTLTTRFPPDQPIQWVPAGPGEYRTRDGHARLGFTSTVTDGVRMWMSNHPTAAFDRLPALVSPGTHRTLLNLTAAVLIAGLIGWPLAALRSRELTFGRRPTLPRPAVWCGWLTAALGLLALLVLTAGLSGGEALLWGVPAWLGFALWFEALFALLALANVVVATRVLIGERGTGGQRLRLFAVAVAAVVLAAVLAYWNLMPWGLPD